jgi:hypothetical protein
VAAQERLTPTAGSGLQATRSTPRLRLASSNALSGPRTPAPNRRLLLVISHGLPPDALDREREVVVEKYPHFRHSVVQLKHAIRERRIWPQDRSVE